MAFIRIMDNKKHIQTWYISKKEIQDYFELIMSKWKWEYESKKEYLKIMGEKSIKDVITPPKLKKKKTITTKGNDRI